MALIVGLTGGIASGKSEAARRFEEFGVPVCDTDQLAREVVAPGSATLQAVAARFGGAALQPGGELDRAWLRKHVFGDPAERRALEAILHPAIRARMRDWRDRVEAPYAILVIPLLVESGLQDEVDRVLVVDAAPDTQLQRLRRRDGNSDELARAMIAAQATRAARLAVADDVIGNEGDLAGLRRQVDALHAQYLALAGSSGTRNLPPRQG